MKTYLTLILLLLIAGCTATTPGINQTPSPLPPLDDGRLAAIECPPGSKGQQMCTMEYNPVCSDGETYGNPCMACAVVDRYFMGECANVGNDTPPPKLVVTQCTEDQRNQSCTKEYNPVCANVDTGIRCITAPCPSTEQKTYGNSCSACSDSNVYSYTKGACGASEIPGKQGTHLICENGECRDVNGCPEGYDEYPGQLKQMCVKHYSEAEIKAWQSCTNSGSCTNGSSCVFAPLTTENREISWSGTQNPQGLYNESLKCAPEDYKTFLLHTSGASGVDESGQFYSVIA